MLQLTQDDLQLIAMIMSRQLLIIYNNPSGQPVPVFGHPHTSAKLLCSWVPPTYTGVGGCSSSFAGLCTSLCQTLYKVTVSSFLQPVKVPLAYQPLLQICVISQIAELLSVPSFRPLVKMLNRTRLSSDPLGFTASYHPPTILYTTDHHPQGLSIHPVFNPSHSGSSSPYSNSLRLFWDAASRALLMAH